jgi:hypothetical protein
MLFPEVDVALGVLLVLRERRCCGQAHKYGAKHRDSQAIQFAAH